MANLTKEQIQRLNEDIKNGATLTTVHNSRYHFIIKVNSEAIVIQSMIAEDQDKGVIINLNDLRNEYENQKDNQCNSENN